MFLCKDSRACSKSAILFSCSLTTEQQLWHFVTHNSSGCAKSTPHILRCLVFIQWHRSNWLHIWHRMGLLHTTCCKRLYFEKTFWIWFYNTFISFSLLTLVLPGMLEIRASVAAALITSSTAACARLICLSLIKLHWLQTIVIYTFFLSFFLITICETFSQW